MDIFVNTSKLHAKMASYLSIAMEMLAKGTTLQDLQQSLEAFMDLSDIRSDNYCHAMLKTGANAGSFCSAPTEEGIVFCVKHAPKEIQHLNHHVHKSITQKRLLVTGQVVDVEQDDEELLPTKKKLVSGIKGKNLQPSNYGEQFTRSGDDYHVGKWGERDSRCKREVEEANGIGFIVERVLTEVDDGISDEEARALIQSHKWRYIDHETLEYGKTRAVSMFQNGREFAIKYYDPNSIDSDKENKYPRDDAEAEKRLMRFYTIVEYLREVLDRQSQKTQKVKAMREIVVKGKLWEEHAAKRAGMTLLKTGSIVGLVNCQRKILELMAAKNEPLEKIAQVISKGVILEHQTIKIGQYLDSIFNGIVPREHQLKGRYRTLDELVDDAENVSKMEGVDNELVYSVKCLKNIKDSNALESFKDINTRLNTMVIENNYKATNNFLELNKDRLTDFGKECKERAMKMFSEYQDFQQKNQGSESSGTEDGNYWLKAEFGLPLEPPVKKDEPLTMKRLKAVDYKEWSKIVFWDKCTKYAREQGLDTHEATISELVKRESGRGVTPYVVLPCLSYEVTAHRNWFCQDVSRHLYGPHYMIPVVETSPNFKDYAKMIPDHIYIRYEAIVANKYYQHEEWQRRYHRLKRFYGEYFGFIPFHPEFLEAREPITMMRAARILGGNHEERLFALKLDEEYLDDIKYDIYRMLYLKGRTKTQDVITLIYEEFAATYIQQMVRETQLIMDSYNSTKGIPDCFYWMNVYNPPQWIDPVALQTRRAGVRSKIDEQGIFSGKYDNECDLVDPSEFNIYDPIALYKKYKKGELHYDLEKEIFLRKKKQLFDDTNETKIMIKKDERNTIEPLPTCMVHIMTENKYEEDRKELSRKKAEREQRPITIEAVKKRIKEQEINEKHETRKQLENDLENGTSTVAWTLQEEELWKHLYNQKPIDEKEIPIVEYATRDEAREAAHRMFSVVRQPGELDVFMIWKKELTKYIRSHIEPGRKKHIQRMLDERKKFMDKDTSTKEQKYNHILMCIIGSQPKVRSKYYSQSGIKELKSAKNYNTISRIIGYAIDDVGDLVNALKSGIWDPVICLQIFNIYRRMVDELFNFSGSRHNEDEMISASPKMKGDITVMNLRYEFEEASDNYKAYTRDLASQLADDIMNDYAQRYNEGLCKMLPMG